ncbi:coA binding domain protein, partial [Vibrio parahaemolyticus V-223/04]
VFLQQI